MMGGEQRRVTFRIPTELVVALERIAVAEDRSLSAEIRRLIRLHVEAFDLSAIDHKGAG
jgi:predicted transcriptional regulator